MRALIDSIESEYRRYKKLAEGALEQMPDEALGRVGADFGNSAATIAWHVGGNLASRFTDFLTSDGEKPWRDREGEFASRAGVPRAELMAHWEKGWSVLFDALAALQDTDLCRTVTIRNVPLTVGEALHRSLSHAASHAGQIVLLGRMARGADWTWLSIAPGGTAAYNANPTKEKGGR